MVRFCFLFAFLFPTFLNAAQPRARANAVACNAVDLPAEKALKHFQGKAAAGDARAKKLHQLLLTGKDAFGVASYSFCNYGAAEEPAGSLQENTISASWIEKIAEDPKWSAKLSPNALKKLNAEKETLRELFGASSYGFAWVQKATGNSAGAKATLQKVFAEKSEEALKSTNVFRSMANPLTEIERIHAALAELATAEEKSRFEKKFQQVKIHVSNLPDSGIVT